MSRREYRRPGIQSERVFETSALACGKTVNPPPGSYHIRPGGPYWTGHFGPGMGGYESLSGSVGTAWPPGSTSVAYSTLCTNWITFHS
jgi:hypothetical protein